ncbi:MAG: 16S rRNA (guanine(527)-N(7))-methyltransferase RsmG [Bacteroidales bacterium]|nr:16S rRNA (guanine(527)-N(7))-methyltransferase RsmG [Bacteroidales bacterium]MBQ1842646.1 16S rRNA (guanine(527)-N(7))-methyltransferase RsmG [Bacteroidales bacterium]SKC53710.1 16S rRNA m(7)G-527 methyltransferase [Bacteroidales bacterium WCE2008]
MNFKEFEDIVVAEFPELTPEMLGKYEAMEALYEEWNAKINVISRKDIGGLYLHHVLHSLAIASYLKRRRPEVYSAWTEGASVLDLGTGGGFPGIPLAVMFPNVRFTLCDSVGKKIIVASEVSKALSLGNVTTVNARAESLPQVFDHVVSRAVTSLDNFYPWVKGKFSGSILYLKGGDIVPEIAELMKKNRLRTGAVSTWPIETWLKDEYFKEKFVIEIEK